MDASSKDKIKALILHICAKIPEELSGLIKLNKIMWFSETESIYQTGEPLTGHMYIRQRFGPVALNAHIMREELVREGALRELREEILPGGHVRRPYITQKEVNLRDYFSEEQIEIIDEQIAKYAKTGAIDISELSHDSIWASLEDADEMPLDVYLIKPVYTHEQKEALAAFAHKRGEEEYGRAFANC